MFAIICFMQLKQNLILFVKCTWKVIINGNCRIKNFLKIKNKVWKILLQVSRCDGAWKRLSKLYIHNCKIP
jgi:hypothetical protein